MRSTAERHVFYLSGQAVELWENSGRPFGWAAEDLDAYARDGQWDLLFNALVLSAALEAATAP